MKSINTERFFYLRGTIIDECREDVLQRNYDNLKSFALLGMTMTSFAVLFGQCLRDIMLFNTEFLLMLLYFMVMFLVTRSQKREKKHSTLAFYLWIIPLMVIGILMGTFLDPNQPSITIMVFMGMLPLFILDKPWRVSLFITVSAAVYIICCYLSKPQALFAMDVVDCILFYVLGVGVNCLILRDRMYNVQQTAKLRILSQTDSLTGLYNRGAGEEKIRSLIAQGSHGLFLLLDVDDFKFVNDKRGHAVGDEVLKAVALQMKECFQEQDIMMRLGGDEFVLFVPGIDERESAVRCIEDFQKNLDQISVPQVPAVPFSVSIGAVLSSAEDHKHFDALYRESDIALYQAKQRKKGSYVLYDNERRSSDGAMLSSSFSGP